MSDNLPEVSKSITEEALWDSLPHEILTHVFLRLPIKSIITCTSVSKTWKSLIQNPSFISTHLLHSSNNTNLLLFRLCPKPLVKAVRQLKRIGDEKEVYALHWDDNTNFHQYTTFDDFPFHGQSGTGVFRVVGTCNGLICLADDLNTYAYNFILWNPCVKKYVQLPTPNFSFRTTGPYTAAVGFGFDSKTNDYKVVRFVTPEDDDFDEGKSTPKVEVYSLATGKWRVVTAQCPKCAVRDTMLVYLRLQAFVNGALHLVCYKTTPEIRFLHFVLVFDLEDEVFREIPLPKHSDMFYWKWVSIMAFGNSIALLEPGYVLHTLDIWVLKNYADASSWTKIVSLDAQAPPQDIPRPFHGFYRKKIPCAKAFRKSGEVILETYKKRLVSRNLETQEVKDLGITGSKFSFVDPYVESLVLLDKPDLAVTNYGKVR
ncbi:F-box protein At3g07870-like isoform X5 [Quercus robur]|uniref:F-box protein At3g07870-like isoform X5 n=1 Tax=Quercus robur TaxID=38942 RepID=UPI0021629863|nr:F-box protein At3g07870-like isoform X5 [Quercus robur]